MYEGKHLSLYMTYAVVGIGEAKLPRKPLLAVAAAALPPLPPQEKILGGLAALQTSLPAGDRVSPLT
jgi:hypothetical protein